MCASKRNSMKKEDSTKTLTDKYSLERRICEYSKDENKINYLKEKYSELYSIFNNQNIKKSPRHDDKILSLMVTNLNYLLLSIEIALKPEDTISNNNQNNLNQDKIKDYASELSLHYLEKIFVSMLKESLFKYSLLEEFYNVYLKPELYSNSVEGYEIDNINKKLKNIFQALFSYYKNIENFSERNSKTRKNPCYFEILKGILEKEKEEVNLNQFIENERNIPNILKKGLTEADLKFIKNILLKD